MSYTCFLLKRRFESPKRGFKKMCGIQCKIICATAKVMFRICLHSKQNYSVIKHIEVYTTHLRNFDVISLSLTPKEFLVPNAHIM